MTNEVRSRRLNINISDEAWEHFTSSVHWGLRAHLIVSIMKLIADAVNEDKMLIGGILSNKYKLVRDDTPDAP